MYLGSRPLASNPSVTVSVFIGANSRAKPTNLWIARLSERCQDRSQARLFIRLPKLWLRKNLWKD